MALQPIAGSSTEPLTTIRDRWALLVGVNRYIEPNFPSLKFCVKDVLALEVTLKELGYRVICMHDELNHETKQR